MTANPTEVLTEEEQRHVDYWRGCSFISSTHTLAIIDRLCSEIVSLRSSRDEYQTALELKHKWMVEADATIERLENTARLMMEGRDKARADLSAARAEVSRLSGELASRPAKELVEAREKFQDIVDLYGLRLSQHDACIKYGVPTSCSFGYLMNHIATSALSQASSADALSAPASEMTPWPNQSAKLKAYLSGDELSYSGDLPKDAFSPAPVAGETPPCEGCEKPATTSDSEGVQLCDECMAELIQSTQRDNMINALRNIAHATAQGPDGAYHENAHQIATEALLTIGEFHCICGKSHSRGPVDGANTYRCLNCGSTYTSVGPAAAPSSAVSPASEEKDAKKIMCDTCGQVVSTDRAEVINTELYSNLVRCISCQTKYPKKAAPEPAPAEAKGEAEARVVQAAIRVVDEKHNAKFPGEWTKSENDLADAVAALRPCGESKKSTQPCSTVVLDFASASPTPAPAPSEEYPGVRVWSVNPHNNGDYRISNGSEAYFLGTKICVESAYSPNELPLQTDRELHGPERLAVIEKAKRIDPNLFGAPGAAKKDHLQEQRKCYRCGAGVVDQAEMEEECFGCVRQDREELQAKLSDSALLTLTAAALTGLLAAKARNIASEYADTAAILGRTTLAAMNGWAK